MANLAKYIVQLEAQTAKYKRDLDGANRRLSKFHKTQRRSLTNIKVAWGALAGAVAAVGFAQIARQSLDQADKLVKLTDRLGGTTEGFSELGFVAERSGVKFETLALGLQRMSRRVAEAAVGTGEAKGAIRELGLDAEKLAALPIDKQFEVIADRLAGVESASDKTRLAMKLFDSEGVALLQTMKGGAAGIQELRSKARELGVTLDADMAQKAVDAKDALTDMNARVTSLARNLTLALAPSLADAAGSIDRFVIGLTKAFNSADDFVLGGQIAEIERDIVGLEFKIRRWQQDGIAGLLFGGTEDEIKGAQSSIEVFQTRLAALRKEQLELLTPPPTTGTGAGTDASFGETEAAAELAAERLEQFKKDAIRIFDETRKPVEQFNASIKALFENPFVDVDTRQREVERLTTVLHDELGKLADVDNPLEEWADKAAAIIDATRTPAENFTAAIKDLLANPLVDVELQQREIARLTSTLHGELEKMVDDTSAAAKAMQSASDEAWRNIFNGFKQFLFDPFDAGLKGMLASFIDTLREMVANQLALSIFGFLGIGEGKGILGLAGGGTVSPRTPYIVGEKGPELFVSNTGGAIVPNSQLGGHSFQFYTTIEGGNSDAQTLLPLLEERDRKLKGEFLDELNRGKYG